MNLVQVRSVVTSFAAIFPAELPDKTMVATLVLTTRFRRPLLVWCGVAAAFVVHVSVAVLAGSLLSSLPTRVVKVVTALLFAVGAFVLWRESREPQTMNEPFLGTAAVGTVSASAATDAALTFTAPSKVVLTAFTTVAVAEWGDLTQLATAGLAARRGDPAGVAIGALLALWAVAALAASLGRVIVARVPVRLIQKIAAAVFGMLAVLALR